MDKQDSIQKILSEIVAVEPSLKQPLQQFVDQMPGATGSISVDSISDSEAVIVGHNNVLQVIKNYNNPLPDDLILRLIALLDAQGKSAAQDLPAWTRGKSPFPGLRALGPNDARIFFGRELETGHLLSRVANPNCRFLLVVGASGSGKSSLVGAGLLPRLKEDVLPGSGDWLVARFTPDSSGDGDPFTALTGALKEAPLNLSAHEIRARLLEKHSGLRQLIEEHLAGEAASKQAILFIDQFEELFTRVTDKDYNQKFQLLLNDAVNSTRILIIATIRDDFYHYCVKSSVLSRLINRHSDSTYALSAPGIVELYEMIAGPARVAGLEFEDGLVRQILEDTGNNPGALALMAYALDQLYKTSVGKKVLTRSAYEAFKGVNGVIGIRAQETFEKLSQGAQDKLPVVFRELLDVDESGAATRKRAPLEQVEHDTASRELTQALVQARLLVTSRSASDQALVEVAHEALFRSWPRLKAWIEETQDDHILLRQVRTAAEWWNKYGRKPEFLWPDERLKPVYEMQKRLEPNWNEHEKEFIRLEVERLWEEIENPNTSHRRRSWIGERLDTLGDPRPGVGLINGILPLRGETGTTHAFDSLRAGEMRLWGDALEHIGLPDIVWQKVDGGSIQIEKQTFKMQPFLIAKYPITYRQFESFIEAEDGFKDARWWKGLSADENHKSKPGEQNFKFYNHPRETVSWYDAVAFCRWLDARVSLPKQPAALSLKNLFTKNAEQSIGLSLPTEWEWQWAATGGKEEYEYPWGKEWDGSKANTSECGLARTTAAGMYLAGSATCGALDMSGNVYEWCLNEYNNPEQIGLNGTDSRVVRGGSWSYDQDSACVSYRYYFNPDFRDGAYGFRLVVRPPSL